MNSILAPIDFSEPSINSLKYAADLSSYFGSKLIILHAYQMPLNTYETAYMDQAFYQVKGETEKLLNNKKSELEKDYPNLEVEVVMEMGFAFDTIKNTVKRKQIDLVVMGIIGGGSFIKKKIIGSTAIKVAKKLNYPLIIVPENARYKPVKKIAYACDYSMDSSSNSITIQVKLYASFFHAKIVVLNIIKNELELADNVQITKSKNYVESKLRNTEHVSVTIKSENVVDGISSFLSEDKVDLLMLYPLKHWMFYSWFHEEVTPELAFKTTVPLLILHD